jgi:hypothetical protein
VVCGVVDALRLVQACAEHGLRVSGPQVRKQSDVDKRTKRKHCNVPWHSHPQKKRAEGQLPGLVPGVGIQSYERIM